MASSWLFIAAIAALCTGSLKAHAQTATPQARVDLSAEAAPATLPSLDLLHQVNAVDGVVLYRAGQLFLAHLDLPGRPARRLLVEPTDTQMPLDVASFRRLDSACFEGLDRDDSGLEIHGDLQGDGRLETVRIRRDRPRESAQVRVFRDGLALANAKLPFAADPCFAAVLEVDADDRPELVVIWISDESDTPLIGVHVYQLPGE